ncbi:MAG TPA: hypothetical protein VG502_20535 [Flexivirga sp.]|uniref:hypothetical protein n=1 Tax=Flexivirga sp. TaxID=1962927 RepID=UPI002BE9657B|nr:hypothetical protein [Flexivirga sp.]HWC24691.1 hypothetical protein [Flexivirga sp.]
MDALEEQGRELNLSGFLSFRGGMAFGGLGYLLVAGLFVVYFGATQGADGHTVRPVVVTIGWILAALATIGYAGMLHRFLRFRRELRGWVRQVVQRDPNETGARRLELRLRRRSTRGTSGPADAFLWGGLAFTPFGFVLPYLALLVQVIGIVDTLAGDGAATVHWIFMLVALAPSLLGVTLGTLVLAGIGFAGAPLRTWRAA